jgi:uncharacterized protein YbcI
MQVTGHEPKSVSVVLSDGILVITFHEALTPAEMTLAESVDGGARLKELQRELFNNSNSGFRRDVNRISGRKVREAAVEIDTMTGASSMSLRQTPKCRFSFAQRVFSGEHGRSVEQKINLSARKTTGSP